MKAGKKKHKFPATIVLLSAPLAIRPVGRVRSGFRAIDTAILG